MEQVEVMFSAIRVKLLVEFNFSEIFKQSYSRDKYKNVNENNKNLSKLVVKTDTLRFIAL